MSEVSFLAKLVICVKSDKWLQELYRGKHSVRARNPRHARSLEGGRLLLSFSTFFCSRNCPPVSDELDLNFFSSL